MRARPLPFDDLKARGTAIVIVRKTLAEIAVDVCVRHDGVQPWEIFGLSRKRHIVRARWEVIWEARQLDNSLHMIGRRFPRPENREGCMDHTSVLHAERRHEARRRLQAMASIRHADEESARAYRDYLRGLQAGQRERAA